MPVKQIKYFVKKILPTLSNMKNTQSKTKPIKIGKQPRRTYCFGCKDFTHNFRPKKVKMPNKVLTEKSHCVVCRSKIKIFKTKNKLTTDIIKIR